MKLGHSALLAGAIIFSLASVTANAKTYELKATGGGPFSFDIKVATVGATDQIKSLSGSFFGDGAISHVVSLAALGNPSWNYDNLFSAASTPVVDNGGFLGLENGNLFNFYSDSSGYRISTFALGGGLYNPGQLVSTTSLSAVPELSTWVMMLAGFGALGFVGWRQKRLAPAQI